MLFKDRLEIWNPGSLPYGLTTAKLREPHSSIPANPLLAEPMYLAGYIERMGTGTGDIIRLCKEADLKEPEFIQEEIFKTVIWRKQAARQAARQAAPKVSEFIKRVVVVTQGEMKRNEIQELLGLKDRENFVGNYLNPALREGYVELKYPDSPNHPQQRYKLSDKGIALRNLLVAEQERK